MRFTRAAGRVLARTNEEFSIEIPLQYEKKVYSKRRVDEVTLNFFGFSVKIFKNSRNQGGRCDIIKREINFNTPKGRALPLSLTVQYRMDYEVVEAERTLEEAQMLANAALSRRMALLATRAELLSKEISFVETETSLILDCQVVCIEDIAVQSEFEVVVEP